MPRLIALNLDHDWRRQRRICSSLSSLGLKLHTASRPPAARALVKRYHYRLVLMRFATLGREVFNFCSFVHNVDTLVMVLMAKANLDIEERLFGCGVDDVVAGRQTSASVLTKRIQAHLRYSRRSWPRSNVVELKDMVVDLARREVRRNGSTRRLPGMLTELLRYFLDNPDRVISRQELAKSSLWADSICTPPEEGGRAMDVSIGKLRRIIERDPRHPQIITAVRGIGWKLGKDHVRHS